MTSLDAHPRTAWTAVSTPPDRPHLDTSASDSTHDPLSPRLSQVLGVTVLVLTIGVFGIFGVTPDGNGFLQPVDTAVSSRLDVIGDAPTMLVRTLSSPVLLVV